MSARQARQHPEIGRYRTRVGPADAGIRVWGGSIAMQKLYADIEGLAQYLRNSSEYLVGGTR